MLIWFDSSESMMPDKSRSCGIGTQVAVRGGVATLAIPSEQRKAGLRANVLEAHCFNETKEIKP